MGDFVTQEELKEKLADFKGKLKKEADKSAKDSLDFFESLLAGKNVAATDQMVYASNQVLNWNPSAITISPQMFSVNERGLSLFGAELFKWPWVNSMESRWGSDARRERRLGIPSSADVQTQIQMLAEGQQTLAREIRSPVRRDARRAETRRQTNWRGRETPAAQEAGRLREIETRLNGVAEEARRVAQQARNAAGELAGS